MKSPRILAAMATMVALVLLCPLFLPSAALAASLPDKVRFGARMEIGDLDVAKEWLDAGLDPNFVADRIGTGLMIAAWTGNVPLMELFVARGADINRTNGYGETALLHAAWKGQKAAVNWLLAHGAKPDREDGEWSALHYAAFSGHADVAKVLLERGANINARSPNGSSVLMMAIYEGQDAMARILIERGADRSVRNERGDNALDWAVKYKRNEVARLIASAAEVATAASQPKNLVAQQSQAAEPESVEDLLRIRRHLETRGIALRVVDERTAAMRARIARAALARQQKPRLPVVLQITARRSRPAEQTMELLPR